MTTSSSQAAELQPAHRPAWRDWFVVGFLLAASYALFIRLHSHALLAFYEDDAFYYFQIGRHIAAGQGSTFDGTHLTNGYHPLWMAVIAALSCVAPGRAFFVLLQAVAYACFAATFLLLRELFLRAAGLTARTPQQARRVANVAAGTIAIGCLLLLRGGMEITLTLPIALALCWFRLRWTFRWTMRDAVVYGLLAAALVLSRLDAVLLVALLFVFDFAFDRKRLKSFAARAVAVVALAFPLLLYGLWNHHRFGAWTTVSSQAKQLRLHHGFTLTQVASSFEPVNGPYRVLVVYPALLIALLCVVSLAKRSRTVAADGYAAVCVALVAFPLVQLPAFFTLSDWLIWPWYLYSVPLAAVGALLWLLRREPRARSEAGSQAQLLVEGLLLLTVGVYAAACTADKALPLWYRFAEDMAPFARTHPGLYAMGDCAGTTAYTLGQPMMQLEGLVMDEAFLANIREQRNLNEVLERYHVRYYVTRDAVPDADGCYAAAEPYQGGPDSPRMHGRFCVAPAATFRYGDGKRDTLRVFDLAR